MAKHCARYCTKCGARMVIRTDWYPVSYDPDTGQVVRETRVLACPRSRFPGQDHDVVYEHKNHRVPGSRSMQLEGAIKDLVRDDDALLEAAGKAFDGLNASVLHVLATLDTETHYDILLLARGIFIRGYACGRLDERRAKAEGEIAAEDKE